MQSISSQNDKFHGSNAFHEFYDVCNNLGASACSHNPKGLDWWKCTFCSIFIYYEQLIVNSYRGVFRILILWVMSVNKIFIYHPQFFPTVLKCRKISIAPVLNTPLLHFLWITCNNFVSTGGRWWTQLNMHLTVANVFKIHSI